MELNQGLSTGSHCESSVLRGGVKKLLVPRSLKDDGRAAPFGEVMASARSCAPPLPKAARGLRLARGQMQLNAALPLPRLEASYNNEIVPFSPR